MTPALCNVALFTTHFFIVLAGITARHNHV